MLKIANIILAHKNPGQLARLAARLSSPSADIFVHVDRKVSEAPFLAALRGSGVRFIQPRFACTWGGYSLARAIIRCLQAASDKGMYDYFNLLSGQDYPLVTAQDLQNHLSREIGRSFIAYDADKQGKWHQEARARYTGWHFTDFRFTGAYFLQRLLSRILPERRFPLPVFYGGNKATWWTLHRECVAYILHAYRFNRSLFRFFRFTWAPDEFLIPSLLMNSPFSSSVVNTNYRYIDWSEGKASPKVLRVDDWDKIIQSGMWFARKFDEDIDPDVMEQIDEYLSRKEIDR
jgi:hypothetical protein